MKEASRYEEWLSTLSNTRFIYNTMSELERMLDNNAIHNNGIKRCFSSLPKLRSAYRDLKEEVAIMTNWTINLDSLMEDYKIAWTFFSKNLNRRANPEKLALELLSFCFPPYSSNGITTKRLSIYRQIVEQDISIPFILLMLMKVIPGYDSKDGDVNDMPEQYERIMTLLQNFTRNESEYSIMPAINLAREETYKSRLMLLFHVSKILDIYNSYNDISNIYDTATNLKAGLINLDIAGYWNESDGKLCNTDFWQIEETDNYGTYFMTSWHKDAKNSLSGIRYTLFILDGDDGNFIYYILHPKAILHKMQGLAYEDADHVWYKTALLSFRPDELPLQRLIKSTEWKPTINLGRCKDEKVVSQYDRWINNLKIVKPFKHLEYNFYPNLYAITKTHLYIPSDNDGEYFKVPKTAYEGFENIHMGDNIGTMNMNGKTYLVFDELMLYIATTKNELEKYNIEIVSSII